MKKIIQIIGFCLLFFNLTAFSQSVRMEKDSLWTIDEISNMSVYLYQKVTDTSGIGGTGTIINHNKRYFLLTANHVAKEMKLNSQIVFRITGDKPIILNLSLFTPNHKIDWINHNEADLSIIELLPFNNDVQKRFDESSFSSKFIYKGQDTLPRDNDVTFFGYPLLDLDLKHFSSLSFTAYLASGLITNKRYDTKSKCTFYYLDQPSMQGASGGGVFCSVKKAMYMGSGRTLLIGVVHGTAGDNTGGKLAAITPSFYIWDLLNKLN
ncbi:hypothetical protein ACFX5F_02835 [Flavobacterium sp. ZS1P70]|uniref:Serine protease n=1 Tax=Flavobacterium zhoui TaxID=3230414 RepID=A0ABW6I1K9_9FLAO